MFGRGFWIEMGEVQMSSKLKPTLLRKASDNLSYLSLTILVRGCSPNGSSESLCENVCAGIDLARQGPCHFAGSSG